MAQGPALKRLRDELGEIDLGSPQGMAAKIAAMIALPREAKWRVRLNDDYAESPTDTFQVHQSPDLDWPQQTQVYPGGADQFMTDSEGRGVQIYPGMTETPDELCIFAFPDCIRAFVIEDFNSEGSFCPYKQYSTSGSEDFNVPVCSRKYSTNGTVLSPSTFTKIVPAHARYDESIVTGADGTTTPTTGSIYAGSAGKSLFGTVRPNPGGSKPFHGQTLGTMQDGQGDVWMWADGNNTPGNTATARNDDGQWTNFDFGGTFPANNSPDVAATGAFIVYQGSAVGGAVPLDLSTGMLNVWAWNEGAPYLVGTVDWEWGGSEGVNAQLGVICIPYPDYYRFEVEVTPTNTSANTQSVNLRFAQVSASHIYRHLQTAHIEEVYPVMKAYRKFAGAMLLRNKTNAQYRAGSATGVQAALATDWQTVTDGFNGSPYKYVKDLDGGAEPWDFGKGAYGFLKPVSLTHFADFRTDAITKIIGANTGTGRSADNSAVPVILRGRLKGDPWICMVAKSPPLGTGVPIQDVELELYEAGEYTTNSQWHTSLLSEYTSADWTRAMIILKSMPQFYENPSHSDRIKAVLNGVGKIGDKAVGAAGLLVKYGPHILTTLGEIAALL